MKNQYTIYKAGLKAHNISVVTEKEPNDDGIIIMKLDEYENSLKTECPGDGENWDVVTGNGMAVLYPADTMKFNDPIINKIVGKGETIRVPENYVEPIGHAKPGGEPLYPHVPKSRQPLFPHVPKGQQPGSSPSGLESIDSRLGKIALKRERKFQPTEKLPATTPQTGTCYADAWRYLIKEEEGYLVHGSVQTIGKRINHAWVELPTGYVWEPESGEFIKRDYFYKRAQPQVEARYATGEAAIMVARSKSFGPWTEQERRQYLGAAQLQAIELLASTEGDPIRKFCCRQCGECAPKDLLEEGRFLDRISWLRSHYQAKHPGMWGKSLPMVEGFEPISPQYRHLVGLVSEPLPREAD